MKHYKILSAVAALFFTTILLVALFFTPKLTINSDILALFPSQSTSVVQSDAVQQIAQDQVSDFISNRLFILVSAPEFSTALKSAENLAALFSAEKAIEIVVLERDAMQLDALLALYRQYSPGLITLARQNNIVESPDKFIQKEVRRRYMSPASMGSSNFKQDPFSVAEAFVKEAGLSQQSNFELTDGVLALEKQGRHFVFLQVTLAGSAFSLAVQEQVTSVLSSATEIITAGNPTVEVLSDGVVLFAAAGAKQGKSEISTVGLGSLVGIMLLLLLVFRSGGIVLLSAAPIVMGVIAGVVVCQFVFGQLHIIALVFGASLIGVSIDYTFHFLITRLKMSNEKSGWSPELGIKRLFNGLTLGLITSASAYASFVFSGFPGFQQIALFSSVGLLAAYLTVVGLFPHVLSRQAQGEAHEALFALANQYLQYYQKLFQPKIIIVVGILLLSVFVSGMMRLTNNDDIRLMQTPQAALLEEHETFQSLTGQQAAHQFFLVAGENPEQMLQRLESLHERLSDENIQAQSIAQWLPSASKQKQSQAQVKEHLLSTQQLAKFLGQLHVSSIAQQSIVAGQVEKMQKTLALSEAGPVIKQALGYPMYLTHENHYYGLVLLDAAPETQVMAALAARSEGVVWVDRVVKTNQLLTEFREKSSQLIMIAVAGIFLLLSLRYGLPGALQVVLPPVLSMAMTLAILGGLAIAINVFNIMALLLVLGIGIDYSLFLRESRTHAAETTVAISLSAITTLLSFGLLALSETQAIQSFGLTIIVGISCCFIFAPLVLNSLTKKPV